ncbi:MAG: hypothetical protein FWJ83_00485 [Limnochordales bacterium]
MMQRTRVLKNMARRAAAASAAAFVLLVVILAAAGPAGPGGGFAASAQELYEVNLLTNPGFEAGGATPAGWVPVNVEWPRRDTSRAYEGRASGLLYSGGREREMAWRQSGIEVVEGGRYVLSGWVRSDVPAVAVLGVDWQDGGTGQRLHRGLEGGGGWERVEMEFVASRSGPVTAVVGAVARGGVWWDNVSLRRVDDRPQQLAAQWEELIRRHGHVFTGLVVDARGLGVRRGMSPRIVDEEGNIVYSGVEADKSVVIGRGLVGYMYDPEEAVRNMRLAVHEQYPYRLPLIVEAVGVVDDPFRASVIVSVADAQRIRRELQKYDFLGRWAVVFIIGDDV